MLFYTVCYLQISVHMCVCVSGMLWCSWLRHCITTWKVVGLVPSDRIVALGLTQCLTEMRTRGISWG
jgi:hypothetical protein